MAFIWDTNPNRITPPPILPVPVGDGEMSYEAKEVANSVNVDPIYGVGTLLWNIATPDADGDSDGDFDIIYQLPSLNVKDIHVTHLEADNVTVYFNATINTANIGVATINTANIVNATIANGRMGVNPTANLQIATKEYVDALAANSIPLGGNLQLLIQAAGDLLVGVSDNTAERQPVGVSNGSLLLAGGTSNTGVYYSAGGIGGTGTHRGLHIGSNMFGGSLMNTEVLLVSVEEIVMDDGTSVRTGWDGLTASISSNVETSGIGFLDTGVVAAQTSYEVWAVRSSSNGAQGLLLHRAPESRVDVSFRAVIATDRRLNYSHTVGAITTINVSQSWLANSNGPLTGIDITLARTGAPIGNIWLTFETLVNGNASGNVLATSRYFDTTRIGSPVPDVNEHTRMRFPFDTTANVVSGTNYAFVVHVDYPRGNSVNPNYITVWGTSPGLTGSTTYPNGECKNFSANTNTWAMANASTGIFIPSGPQDLYFRTIVEKYNVDLLMPTGYDQKCLLSYCAVTNAPPAGGTVGDGLTNGWGPRIGPYWQYGRRITVCQHTEWQMNYNGIYGGGQPLEFQTGTGCEAIELKWLVPPTPCFVTIMHYSGVAGPAAVGVGRLDTTDMWSLSSSRTLVEVDGQYQANTNFGIMTSIGPILVEFGTMMIRQPAGVGQSWIQEIEF